MEERYQLLAKAGVRHVTTFNQLGHEEIIERLAPETDEERDAIPTNLPFIVIVADEMADLMMTAGKGRGNAYHSFGAEKPSGRAFT